MQSALSKEVQAYLAKKAQERLPTPDASKEVVDAFMQEELHTLKLNADAIRAASQIQDNKTIKELSTTNNRPLLVRATPTAEQLSQELEDTYGIVLDTGTLATDLEAAQLRIAEAEVSAELEKLVAGGEADATSILELAEQNHAAHAATEHDPKISTEQPTDADKIVWKELLKEMPASTRQVLKDMRTQIVRVVGMRNEELAQVLVDMKDAAIAFVEDQWTKDLPKAKRLVAEKIIQSYFEKLTSGKGIKEAA